MWFFFLPVWHPVLSRNWHYLNQSPSMFFILVVDFVIICIKVLVGLLDGNIIKSMVSCQKGPTCHAYAWQIGPFWQDTFKMSYPFAKMIWVHSSLLVRPEYVKRQCWTVPCTSLSMFKSWNILWTQTSFTRHHWWLGKTSNVECVWKIYFWNNNHIALVPFSKCIEAETKWTPIGWYLPKCIFMWIVLYFDSNYTETCSQGSNW